MQKTAFLLAYTKKSTTLCFQVLIIRSMRVVCKLRHVFLAQLVLLISSVFLKLKHHKRPKLAAYKGRFTGKHMHTLGSTGLIN